MRDIITNLVAAGIAFLAGWGSRNAMSIIRRFRLRRHRRMLREQRWPGFTRPWLVNYYRKSGHAHDLYSYEHQENRIEVPLLMKPTWNLRGHHEDAVIDQSTPHRRSTIKIDQKVLRRRKRYLPMSTQDGEPWNDLIACVHDIIETDNGPRVRIGLAEYFQFLSACGPLEDETYRAIRSWWRRTPIRDRTLRSAQLAAKGRLGAQAVGMQVATIFQDGSTFKILIQRRSNSVSIYGGALAVVPVFGCQTIDLSEGTRVSLFHNFLREVYEELYGGVELERRSNRVDPLWFYREPPMVRILKARQQGLLDFSLLGFGFDALNGELDILAMALFKRSRFTANELHEMITNWEINDIQVWPLFGQQLTDALIEGEFSPGSVYTIVRTRELIKSREGDLN